MRRRDFILASSATIAWPFAAHAHELAMPVVGFVHLGSTDVIARLVAAFRKGLNEVGYAEGKNVTVEYHQAGDHDHLKAVIADLVHRQVAVIDTPGGAIHALAAKAATTTISIVFIVGEDPVQLGLVASLARPGGNATGINTFSREAVTKRLRLLIDLVPKAARIAVLVNPINTATAEPTIRDVREAATSIGLQIQVLNASTIFEIDAAFATLARERADALYVAPDSFFAIRREQFATLTARDRMPTAFSQREFVSAGGLMSYGTDTPDIFHQMGVYTGKVLKGAKPADLPVLQATKFELVINLNTAKAIGLTVPPSLLALADEVIE